MISITIFAVLAASIGYDCAIEAPLVVSISDESTSTQSIDGLPSEALKFGLTMTGDKASVDWPNSPLQLAGDQTILPTSEVSGMILYVNRGPCLFTERACASMLSYAEQADGSLSILVQPTAISRNAGTDVRFPFVVFARGKCNLKASVK